MTPEHDTDARHAIPGYETYPMNTRFFQTGVKKKVRRAVAMGIVSALAIATASAVIFSSHDHRARHPQLSVASSHLASARNSVIRRELASGPLRSQGLLPPGFTAGGAAAIVRKCTSADAGTAKVPESLHAAFQDAVGSTMILSNASGWSDCALTRAGAVFSVTMFEDFAQPDGWAPASLPGSAPAQTALPAGDLPAHWITGPVELDADGYSSLPSLLLTEEGRVAADIHRVSIEYYTGLTLSSAVENGFFAIRSTSPAAVAGDHAGIEYLRGYGADGQLIYQSSKVPSTPSSAVTCYVTPQGQAVTPPMPGQKCETAVPWP